MAKRVNNNDSIGDIQGHSEDYQQCQDFAGTSPAKHRRYMGLHVELDLKNYIQCLKGNTLENRESGTMHVKIMEGFDTFPLSCIIRSYKNGTILGGLQIVHAFST